jgi:hypothetical protein
MQQLPLTRLEDDPFSAKNAERASQQTGFPDRRAGRTSGSGHEPTFTDMRPRARRRLLCCDGWARSCHWGLIATPMGPTQRVGGSHFSVIHSWLVGNFRGSILLSGGTYSS